MASRILIDHAGNKGLGDIVCETNFYAAFRERHPQAEIFSRNCRSIAWGNPHIDGFDAHTPDSEFDLVIRVPNIKDFDLSLKDALAHSRSIFDHFHRQIGLDSPPASPKLYVLPREMEELGLEDDGEEGLIIALSADSKEFDRRWGAERFKLLADYLESRYQASLIELGSGHSDGHLGIGYDMVGQTDLRQTMAVLSLSDLFIGNHGGLTHLAGGVGTPILSPWGASHPFAAYAYDDDSKAVEPELPCQHCRWKGVALPQCISGDLFARTPCTQLITVEQMMAAADEMVAALKERRSLLQQRKEVRRAAARDPLFLARFSTQDIITPYTHGHVMMGGPPEHWAYPHYQDNFARLKKIVAFPDWLSGRKDWTVLLRNYMACTDANSDYMLMLSTSPLIAADAIALIEDFIVQEIKPSGSVPKIILILGALSQEQRVDLVARSCVYVPLGGSYDLPDCSPGVEPAYLQSMMPR